MVIFVVLKKTEILYFGRKKFGAARNRRITIKSSVKELVWPRRVI